MFNVVDLFCGAGGFSYGFEKAGFNILLGVDNEEFKLKTYSQNIHTQSLLENIENIKGKDIQNIVENKKIHVIIGSPPCESYSTSNPKKVLIDSTSREYFPLAYQFFRVVIEIMPVFFIMENVPRFFETYTYFIIYNLFRHFGYTLTFNLIDSEKFGIPQKRKRGFLTGNLLNKELLLIPTHNEKENQITLEQAIGDLALVPPSKMNDLGFQIIPELNYSYYQTLMHITSHTKMVKNHIDPENTDAIKERLKFIKPGEYYGNNHSHLRSSGNDISKVITSGFGSPSNDGETMHYKLNRCLTFREAARIQSFDDNFIFYVDNISRNKIREKIGDAVPPLLALVFALEIKKILEEFLSKQIEANPYSIISRTT